MNLQNESYDLLKIYNVTVDTTAKSLTQLVGADLRVDGQILKVVILIGATAVTLTDITTTGTKALATTTVYTFPVTRFADLYTLKTAAGTSACTVEIYYKAK